MKLLLISNNFPNSAEPVRGIFTYHIAKSLQRKCDLEVIAPLPWIPQLAKKRISQNHRFAFVPAEENINGIKVYHPRYFVIPKVLGFLHGAFMIPPLLKLLKKLERDHPIDLINAHWLFPDGVAAAWVGKILGKPTVLTGLGCDLNYYPSLPFRKKLIKQAIDMASLVTVKGNQLKDTAVELGIPKEKIFVIPNGLDFQKFVILARSEARRRLGISDNGQLLLTVGSLDEVKGSRYLIEALKGMVNDSDNKLRLLIVGDGPLKNALFLQARELGIENRISFFGKRPHNEIPLWMNAANLFCLPSLREGRPNVLIEALACGTPVVASNVGSIPEIIQDINGMLVKPEDSENLRQKILVCLNRPWERNLIRESVAKFSWNDCAQLYMDAYLKASIN